MHLATRRATLRATVGLAGSGLAGSGLFGAGLVASRPAWALAPPDGKQAPDFGAARPIEAFGRVGTADDTATFNAAASSGVPFRLAARAYRLAGPVAIHPELFVMHGVPGVSRILGGWFTLRSTGVVDVDGVIWDGDGKPTGNGPAMVAITGAPRWCALRRCGVLRGTGAAGLLLSLAAGPKQEDTGLVGATLQQIEAAHNAGAGIWVEHADGLLAAGLRLHDNRGVGLRLNRFANRAGAPVQRVAVRDSFAWRNTVAGFAAGVYNEAPGGQKAVAGPNLPDAVDIDFSALFAWENGGYGIAVQGQRVRVSGCRTWRNGSNGGIVVNARRCDIQGSTVHDERAFGIDAGGSVEVDISQCRLLEIDGTGLNLGGGKLITGSGNHILGCTGKAVHVGRVEFGGGEWLQFHGQRVHLTDTTIDIARMKAVSAILVEPGVQDVLLDGLEVIDSAGAVPADAALKLVQASTDSIAIRRARFNGSARFAVVPAEGVLTVPDIAATVVLPAAPQSLRRVQTYSMGLVGPDGIGWISVTNPGRGYTAGTTTATLSGDGDVAAVGTLRTAVWAGRGGAVIGIDALHPGRGFHRATVRIAGRGQGATATVQIGLPIPREKRLRLVFPAGGRLGGELPALSVAAGGVVELTELAGRWIVSGRG